MKVSSFLCFCTSLLLSVSCRNDKKIKDINTENFTSTRHCFYALAPDRRDTLFLKIQFKNNNVTGTYQMLTDAMESVGGQILGEKITENHVEGQYMRSRNKGNFPNLPVSIYLDENKAVIYTNEGKKDEAQKTLKRMKCN